MVSCENIFSKKSQNTLDLKASEQPINFSSIDAYPLLPECENITDRTEQKECFYQKLTGRIQNTLDNNLFELPKNIKGSVLVKINVSSKGKVSVTTILLSNEIKKNIPKLDSLIHKSIALLPVLQPAIKAGIPVTSEFSLPIRI